MNAPARAIVAETVWPGETGKYKLRVDDYLLLDGAGSFRGEQTELVDGDIIVISPEWMPHMRVKDEIAYRLRRAIEALGLDLIVGTGGSVQLSEVDQPRPDVIVMRPVLSERAVPREAVMILVEVSSTTLSFDLDEKAPLYARFDIPEHRTVDVAGSVLHRWACPTKDGYAEHQEIAFGEQVLARTIAGLMIETAAL